MPEKNELTIIVKLKDLATRGLRKLGLASDQTVRRVLNGIGSLATKFLKLNLAIVGVTAAMVALAGMRLKRLADELDFIGKTAKRLGVTVESLTQFRHVAELSGLTLQEVTAGLAVFSRNLEDAKNGVVKKRDAFRLLGLEVETLVGKEIDLNDLILQVAQGMGKVGTASQQTAALMEIFGRSGSKLGSIVKQDAAALREMIAESRHLTGDLSTDTVAKFESFNDALVRVKRAIEGVEIAIAAEILPGISNALNDFANDIADNRQKIVENMLRMAVEGGRHIVAFGKIFGTALTVIEAKMKLLLIVFQSVVTIYTTGAAIFDKLAGSQEDAAESALKAVQASEQLKKTWESLFETVQDPGRLSREVEKVLGPLEKMLAKIEAARKLPAFPAAGEPTVVEGKAPKAEEVQKLTELEKLVGGLGAGLDKLKNRWSDTFETAKTAAIAAGNAIESSITSGLEGMILGTTKVRDAFKEMGKGILRALAQVIAKLIATRVLMLAFGGGGSILGSIFGGGGGTGPAAGPSSLGGGSGSGPSSLPSGLGGGGGGTTNNEVNLTIVANDAKGFDRLLRERRRTLEDLISNALQNRRDVIVDVRRT